MATLLTAVPKLYIGIDIHKKSWSVHLRTDISDHKTLTMPSQCDVLYNYVEQNFPDHEIHMTYEISGCGFGIGRYFLNLGWNVTVVNPGDIPRINKHKTQKTDKIDSRNLAKQLAMGQLRGIFIPDEQQDFLKSLLRQRAEVSENLRKLKNTIKSMLLYHSIKIPLEFDNPTWSNAFIQWLNNLQFPFQTGHFCLASKLRLYQAIYMEYLQLANELRAYCRKHYKKDYYLLKSIPGIGGYLASAILAEIGDLRRFSSEAQFASYVGIIPQIRNSGATEQIYGINPRCRALLRSYIIESAWVAFRLDPEMQAYYRTHIGKNPKRIIVKIARKLLNRMLSVIKNEQPYQINYSKPNVKIKNNN